jgi:hypothetical protein
MGSLALVNIVARQETWAGIDGSSGRHGGEDTWVDR